MESFASHWLQRGRVPEHAEREHAGCLFHQGADGFNEAACRSTRRVAALSLNCQTMAWLQRGRVPEHAESQALVRRQAALAQLQRGRVPEHAESRSTATGSAPVAGFNEAACRSTRRAQRHHRGADGRRSASTRPRAGARGELFRHRLGLHVIEQLQRGRVPEHAERTMQWDAVAETECASTRPRAGARGEGPAIT